MTPIAHFSLPHHMPPQAGPSASGVPSPSQPARPIETIRAELEACGEALAEAYACQKHAGQRSGSRPPTREELPDSVLRPSPGLAFRLCGLGSRKSATVTYHDAQSGLKRYWSLSGTPQEIARIERQAAQYASLREELQASLEKQASPTSLENLPDALLQNILSEVPTTQESKVLSLAQTSRALRAATLELARKKAQVVRLQAHLAQLDQIDQYQRLPCFMVVFNDVMHGKPELQGEFRTSMAHPLAVGLGALPQGAAVSSDVFNTLMELARGIADPAARGETAQALSVGLYALPEGERGDKFDHLVELVRGIDDPVAREQATRALAGNFIALPASPANTGLFNNLAGRIPDIADPATRGEAVRGLAVGLWALPAGAARIDGFNRLVELARGIADPVARRRVTRKLDEELVALPNAAHGQARASLQDLAPA